MTEEYLNRLLEVHCSGPDRTHWEGCEFAEHHNNCAVHLLAQEVKRLQQKVERLERSQNSWGVLDW